MNREIKVKPGQRVVVVVDDATPSIREMVERRLAIRRQEMERGKEREEWRFVASCHSQIKELEGILDNLPSHC
ncbi:hypothetical protein ACIOEX_25150 [Streptomyces sp. NPDC087850]|uniref:hypothetical protein n=1 Tax=Streptomyces sp. NPDC087850 TaxID=3365809 RepID=UPI0037F13543